MVETRHIVVLKWTDKYQNPLLALFEITTAFNNNETLEKNIQYHASLASCCALQFGMLLILNTCWDILKAQLIYFGLVEIWSYYICQFLVQVIGKICRIYLFFKHCPALEVFLLTLPLKVGLCSIRTSLYDGHIWQRGEKSSVREGGDVISFLKKV